MSFPPANEMFQFAGFAFHTYVFSMKYPCKGWVSPFGNPRIKVCSRLPRAYRRVLRPSSPLHAKAFTRCPFLCLRYSRPCAGKNPRPERQNSFTRD